MMNIESLRQKLNTLPPKIKIALFIVWYLLTQWIEAPIFRRVSFFALALVVLFAIFPTIVAWFKKSNQYYSRITFFFLAVSLGIKLIPGAYFPPFFGGIAGWTLTHDSRQNLALSGVQLVDQDGQFIWYSNGLTSPINFIGRQISKHRKKEETAKQLLATYFRLYERSYPLLEKGYYASERYLGHLSYPEHNPCRHLPYQNFPPHRIAQLRLVRELYDPKTLAFQERIIEYEYFPKTGEFRKRGKS
ncbi:MAG TPA: hypothetical protein V6C99_02535 [Oculatellaceae cyanobacterium]